MSQSVFGCGGSIITIKHVLTASHCVLKELIPRNYALKKVRIGEWNRATDPDCQEIDGVNICSDRTYDIKISKVFSHESYNSRSLGKPNDIAILKLQTSIRFTDFVKPICLFGFPYQDDGLTATVIGFGKTENGTGSEILLKTDLDVVNNQKCSRNYQYQGHSIAESQLCAARLGSDSW